ncbi:PH domain-containing protein [Amycolatopsis thermophila]|uniref:Low molecular weight protein antigen 6 PH domain-containing protein n=1 Tax=Amycolatopsis thermophila TaxID=206084 RepID=A0ABU0ENF9_9PSEU|nr:PH domain-containing protein [Amycolatopsis thermophila]MDQ0376831.1 hypothetical protein [Amycolatopsis thermophila]
MAENQQEGRKAIFRVPLITLLFVVFLAVCMIPAAFADVPGLWVMYVIPIGMAVYVLRTRTIASTRGLSVRTVFGHREMPWSSLKGLTISKKAKVSAVLADGSEVALPTVRTRHLPVISLVSEGRMEDPSGLTDDMDADGGDSAGEAPAKPGPADAGDPGPAKPGEDAN